jgi:hypothetical protein
MYIFQFAGKNETLELIKIFDSLDVKRAEEAIP